MAGLGPRTLQLVQRRHERLGHVATTEVVVEAPLAVLVGLQQRLRDGRRPSLDMRPIEARRAGPLDEESDAKAILPRPRGCERPLSDGTAATGQLRGTRQLHAGGHVDAHCRHVQHRLPHVRRIEPACEDHRQLARHHRGHAAVHRAPGAPGERASGGIEKEPLGAGCEERPAGLDRARGH